MSSALPVNPSEIDVVIQGAISGQPTDPARLRLTAQCLDSLRTHLPGARLILSTWEGSDVAGLDFDDLVVSRDPGGQTRLTKAGKKVGFNLNRQLVSTQAGLAATERPFALKFRTDLTLNHAGFLQYWDRHPQRLEKWKLLQDRVLVGSYFTTNPYRLGRQPFSISDWVTFGRREDVQQVWSAPLFPEEDILFFEQHPELDHPFESASYRYTAEQHIWLHFLRRHAEVPCEHQWDFGPHNEMIHNLALVNNAVVLEPRRFGLRFRKYGLGPLNKLSMYSYTEWCDLYRQYCQQGSTLPTRPLRLGLKNTLADFLYRHPSWYQLIAQLSYQYTKRSAWLGKRGWW